jgi:hypothetical protein
VVLIQALTGTWVQRLQLVKQGAHIAVILHFDPIKTLKRLITNSEKKFILARLVLLERKIGRLQKQ